MHIFHPSCFSKHIGNEIAQNKMPLKWPAWHQKLHDREIYAACTPEQYQKYLSLQFEYWVGDEKNKLLYWPTPDWDALVDIPFNAKLAKYNWAKCK